jgi:hypothetical protein
MGQYLPCKTTLRQDICSSCGKSWIPMFRSVHTTWRFVRAEAVIGRPLGENLLMISR